VREARYLYTRQELSDDLDNPHVSLPTKCNLVDQLGKALTSLGYADRLAQIRPPEENCTNCTLRAITGTTREDNCQFCPQR
jgi:hypothetical protein